MSTSSDQQPPGATRRTGQPSTQEIPVVSPAPARPATGATALPPPGAATPAHGMQPTGPVDFVPGLPGAGILPPPPTPTPVPAPPAAEPGPDAPPTSPATSAAEPPGWPDSLEPRPRTPKRRGSRPADRQALAGLALAVLSVGLLEVGLLLRFGTESLWSALTLWSAFATFCAVLSLAAFVAFYPAGNRLRSSAIWRIAAGGLVGLSVFWILVVLPDVASDRGFVLTAALGCLGTALWIGPRRKD